MSSSADPTARSAQSFIGARPEGAARRLGRVTMGTIVAACALSMAASAVFPAPNEPAALLLLIGLLYFGSLALLAATALTNFWCWIAPRRAGSMETDDKGIRLRTARGARTIARHEIAAGWLTHVAGAHGVELRLANGNVVSATVASKHEGDALLDAAGVAPDKRALSMRLGGALVNTGIALGALGPGLIGGGVVSLAVDSVLHLPAASMGFMMFTLMALAAPLALWLFGAPQVEVGDDGVSISSGPRRRFIAFSDIVSVTTTTLSVVLTLRDGRKDSIATHGTPAARRDALVARIADEIASASKPRSLSDRAALLDRNGRTVEAWALALRAVVNEGDSYRHAGLSREELIEVLDDARAPAERRVAAAYALSVADKSRAAERVRVAIDATAQAPVRVALSRAADGTLDEEAIAAATEDRVRVEAE